MQHKDLDDLCELAVLKERAFRKVFHGVYLEEDPEPYIWLTIDEMRKLEAMTGISSAERTNDKFESMTLKYQGCIFQCASLRKE